MPAGASPGARFAERPELEHVSVPRTHRPAGFTLIELMATVAIAALLATIALPSYEGYLQRTRRADAKTFLSGMAQQLERCFTRFGSYNHANCGVGAGPFTSPEGRYHVSISNRTSTSFTLIATPRGAQARDSQCTSFTLDHLGQASASGRLGNDCWDR
jgi:type IV pilus assembly protein PilE